MALCSICREKPLASPREQRFGVCEGCIARGEAPPDLGVDCARCGKKVLVALAEGERAICETCQALGLPAVVPASRRPLAPCPRCGGRELSRSLLTALGPLEAYACVGCGHTELYALWPEKLGQGIERIVVPERGYR